MSEQEWLLVIVGLLHLGAGFLLGCWFRQGAVDRMQQRIYEVVAEFSDGYMKGFVAGVKAESDDA